MNDKIEVNQIRQWKDSKYLFIVVEIISQNHCKCISLAEGHVNKRYQIPYSYVENNSEIYDEQN